MHIFIGLKEIANVTTTYAKGFQVLGHETYTVVTGKKRFYPDSHYDVVVSDAIRIARPGMGLLQRMLYQIRLRGFLLLQLLRVLVSCDVLIFVYGTSFLPGYLDYPIFKLLGKRIVSVFCGSDILYWYAYEQEMRLLGMFDEIRPYAEHRKRGPSNLLPVKLRVVQAAERHADLILSQPSMGQLQTRPYMRFNIPLDLSQYRFNVPGRSVPIVLHAPSRRAIKGTEYVLETIEQLQREGLQFEFRLIENMPNAQVRELLAESDIVVDQMFSQTVATLALESMATGNVTLARYRPEYARIPRDCPVVNVTVATLANRLREVILDRDLRSQLAHAGRSYVEEHHCHVHVAQQVLDWLDPGGIQEYDFVPTFFQDEFVMSSELLDEERRRVWKRRMQSLVGFFRPDA